MRLAALCLLSLPLLSVSESRAGDAADLNVLGFSADGAVFAFEEYGVQDGSGFPYANRYYIDTATDRYVAGSPVRVRLDDESASVETAREQARAAGETILGAAELEANRGFTAGFNALMEHSADPYRMAVNPRPVFPPIDDTLEVRLQEIGVAEAGDCPTDLGDIVGFRLMRIGAKDGEQTRTLHEDKSIPQSRGCPTGYRIGAIQTFERDGAPVSYAVVIAVRQIGFEGPDYRWMAVTGRW